jgi:hypothetical protein
LIDCLIIFVKNKLFASIKKPHELMLQPNMWTGFEDGENIVPDQYLCLVHTLVYSFMFIVLMSGNTCALIPKIPEAS